MNKDHLINIIAKTQEKSKFSGAVLVQKGKEWIAEIGNGFANRSEQIKNTPFTRFGIASGCKLFTAIAICQLVEKGTLSFETKLEDCLDIPFPLFDKNITVHHLLTHTSGIPDYFDEEVMDDFEELWVKNPMYLVRNLENFLPLFQNHPMKFNVGERFHYNNAGYILLGLIVGHVTQLPFTDYVQKNIFEKAKMGDAGYFELDSLPPRTALGYIDFPNGTWKTNIYSVPVKGGSDGGAFVTVKDMAALWDALTSNLLMSEKYTQQLLSPHIRVNNKDRFYGYGIWIEKRENVILKYHIMGYDPGVSFHSAFYPELSIKTIVCSNKSEGAYTMMKEIEDEIIK
jgi:CubicO group peptidase (beta-lactamase class C family)